MSDVLTAFVEAKQELSEAIFTGLKSDVTVELYNQKKRLLFQRALGKLAYFQSKDEFLEDELLQALSGLTYEEWQRNVEQLSQQLRVEAIMIGGAEKKDFTNNFELIGEILGLTSISSVPRPQEFDLKNQSYVYREISTQRSSEESCTTNYYQVGHPRLQELAALEFLNMNLAVEAFS